MYCSGGFSFLWQSVHPRPTISYTGYTGSMFSQMSAHQSRLLCLFECAEMVGNRFFATHKILAECN